MTNSQPAESFHSPRFDPWLVIRSRVLELAAGPGPLLVVTDFDGTLAPISPDPLGARIVPLGRAALRRLARLAAEQPERLRLVVLSGRTALDVASRVRVGGLRYLGNHGLEFGDLARGRRAELLAVAPDPRLVRYVSGAQRLAESVRGRLGNPPWLFVEEKGPSVAFHFRQADDPERARLLIEEILGRLDPSPTDDGFVRLDGRRVIELRPRDAGGKGAAVATLLREHRPGSVLVLGDDRSDADAFRVLASARAGGEVAGLAVAIHGAIETPPEIVEAADLLLREPREAARLLSLLAGALQQEPSGLEHTAAAAPTTGTKPSLRPRPHPGTGPRRDP